MKLNASRYINIKTTNIYNKYTLNNIKICLLSDIHIGKLTNRKDLESLIKILSTSNIDYIVISGDLIDTPSIIDKYSDLILDFLKRLGEIAKTFIGIGNHDYIDYSKNKKYNYDKEFFSKINKLANVYLLDDNTYTDNNIHIVGITLKYNYYEDYKDKENIYSFIDDIKNKYNLYKHMPNKLKIAIIHSPEIFNEKIVFEYLKDFDLILSGHMHCGLLPYFLDNKNKTNGLITPKKKLFPKYVKGLKTLGTTSIITSSGFEKLSKTQGLIFRPFNIFYYKNIDFINVSKNNKNEIIDEQIFKI